MPRLIFAEPIEKFIQDGLNKPNGDLHQFGHDAIEIMACVHDADAIDPVHAAGGCYCRECKHRFVHTTKKYRQPMRLCMRLAKEGLEFPLKDDEGFCSWGVLKEVTSDG